MQLNGDSTGRHIRLGGVLLLCLLTLKYTFADAATGLTLAVHPYLSSSEIEQRFTPLARQLAKALGLPVTVRVSTNYDAHIQVVGQGMADLAYVGPAELLIAETRYGHQILLGQAVFDNHKGLTGHLVVRQSGAAPQSGRALLRSLRHQRAAFVDRKSSMGYLVPMAILEKAGVRESDFQTMRFVGSHENVALGVLAGEFDVGAVNDETFEKYRPRGLHSLYSLPAVPEHVFVVSPRVPAEWQSLIRTSLLQMAENEAGHQALRAIRPDFSKIAPVNEKEFASVRALLGMSGNATKTTDRRK